MSEVPDDIAALRSVPQFHGWVVWEDGRDEQDNWIGWCPLHDPNKEREASAEFNFKKGVMRCANGAEGDCHKGKRCMSLSNVFAAMRSAGD